MNSTSRVKVDLLCFILIYFITPVSQAQVLFPENQQPTDIEDLLIGQQTVFIPQARGINNSGFPSQAICTLKANDTKNIMMATGQGTYILESTKERFSNPVWKKKIIDKTFDNVNGNYSIGIGSLFFNDNERKWLGIYDAKDGLGIASLPNVDRPSCFGIIGALETQQDFTNAKNIGPILKSPTPLFVEGWEAKFGPAEAWRLQGLGEPTACLSKDGNSLMCWYTDWNGRIENGSQICLARSPVDGCSSADSWQKYFEGEFAEPGLGGKETAVIVSREKSDCFSPQVQFVKEWDKYLMVFGCLVYSEINQRDYIESGFYLSTSVDGISWTSPKLLIPLLPMLLSAQSCYGHPSLLIDSSNPEKIRGTLLYAHSPAWPRMPHRLTGNRFTIKHVKK